MLGEGEDVNSERIRREKKQRVARLLSFNVDHNRQVLFIENGLNVVFYNAF